MILVVEDNKALRVMVKKGLEREGFVTDIATDGKEAIEKLKDSKPDLIISDIVMPEMDGFEFLEQVREDNPLIPFIFLTVKKDVDDYSKGYELGATDYITKPFEMNELVNRVNCRLESSYLIRKFIEGERDNISLSDVRMIDLLHALRAISADIALKVTTSEGEGKIEFERGEIISAEFNDKSDKEALSALSIIKEGEISKEE